MEVEGKTSKADAASASARNRSSGSSSSASGGSAKTSYTPTRIIDKGSFGTVFEARVGGDGGRRVAIKKVLQDPRYKNRELQMMKLMRNGYVCCMENHFLSSTTKGGKESVYLNVVLEYMPTTLYAEVRRLRKASKTLPFMETRAYSWQLCAGLAYVHSLGVCHRDIKPQNVLIDPKNRLLKVCDFGSAKKLEPGQPNIAYICSRYYRAPELIFGAEEYTTAIDMWSAGCVIAECVLQMPLFAGSNMMQQLSDIMKVLGTPTKEERFAMNKDYTGFKLPRVSQLPWKKVFRPDKRGAHVMELCEFVKTFLRYVPKSRPTAADSLKHPFFAPLFKAGARYENGDKVQKFEPL